MAPATGAPAPGRCRRCAPASPLRPPAAARCRPWRSARSIGRSTIGCTTVSAVAASSAWAPGPRAPHRSTTGVLRGRASVATPIAVLPCSVCSSARPSPVMTRSAASSASARPTSSATTSTPGRTTAPVKPSSPAVVPPAAPAPGRSATSRPVATSMRGRTTPAPRPALRLPRGLRPSAGRTWRPPRVARTAGWSRRTRRRPSPGQPRVEAGRRRSARGWPAPRRRRAARFHRVRGIGRRARAAGRSAVGRGRSAEPDRDPLHARVERRAEQRRRCPRVEARRAFSGVRSSGVSRARPDAAAISTNAPRPASSSSQSASIGRPKRVGRRDCASLGGLAERIGNRGQGALAAVGHRAAQDLVVRPDARPARGDGARPPRPSRARRRTSRARRGRAGIGLACPSCDPRIPGEAPAVGPHRRGSVRVRPPLTGSPAGCTACAATHAASDDDQGQSQEQHRCDRADWRQPRRRGAPGRRRRPMPAESRIRCGGCASASPLPSGRSRSRPIRRRRRSWPSR